jgi:hypothetical protein
MHCNRYAVGYFGYRVVQRKNERLRNLEETAGNMKKPSFSLKISFRDTPLMSKEL